MKGHFVYGRLRSDRNHFRGSGIPKSFTGARHVRSCLIIASVVSFLFGRCTNLSSGVSNCTRRIDTKFTRNCILIGQCAQFFARR